MPDELEILFERHEGGHRPPNESQWPKVPNFVQKLRGIYLIIWVEIGWIGCDI